MALSPEVAAMRGLRDALRADPVLRRRYAALKRAIVAGEQPRRLYQDDLDPDNPDRLAHDPPTPPWWQPAQWPSATAKAPPPPAMGQVLDREPLCPTSHA